MSVATRCTACRTVFRVVQDQLKVSEGWVRCGRCNEVFNATEDLFEIGRDAPPSPAPGATFGAAAVDIDTARADDEARAPAAFAAGDVAAGAADLPEALAADTSDPDLVDRIDAALFSGRGAAATSTGHRADAPRSTGDDGDDRDAFAAPSEPGFDPFANGAFDRPAGHGDAPGPLAGRIEAASPDGAAALEPLAAGAGGPGPEPVGRPTFVRDAERAASWRTSGARLRLALGVLALAAVLGLQAVHHHRDLVAAAVPALKPALVAWCGAVACRVDAPRRIEDISVENAALNRVPESGLFRLSVGLRNRGRLALTLPSVELSLTDGSGQLVARRALSPTDFRAASPLLSPGTEAALQLLLSIGTPRVSGYTVEIFYP